MPRLRIAQGLPEVQREPLGPGSRKDTKDLGAGTGRGWGHWPNKLWIAWTKLGTTAMALLWKGVPGAHSVLGWGGVG